MHRVFVVVCVVVVVVVVVSNLKPETVLVLLALFECLMFFSIYVFLLVTVPFSVIAVVVLPAIVSGARSGFVVFLFHFTSPSSLFV